MTFEEATQILGPEVCARIDAQVAAAPPMSQEQLDYLVALWTADDPPAADSAA